MRCPTTRRRPGALWLAATACMLPWLPGCTALGLSSRHARATHSPVDPRTVVWAIAALCRDAHPELDPRPVRGPVPVVGRDDGSFAFVAARASGDTAFRCETNGRLPQPRGRWTATRGYVLEPPTFAPSGEHTIAPGSADLIAVDVAPRRDGGCDVQIVLEGAGESRELVARMLAAVDVLTASEQAAASVDCGDPARAEATIDAAFARLEDGGVAGLEELLPPLYANRAAARLALGDLPGARAALSSAAAGSGHPELQLRLAELDLRLARIADAKRTLGSLAADRTVGAVARISASQAAEARALSNVASDTGLAAARARELLAAGDVEGSTAWLHAARAAEGRPVETLDLELARARGDHRTAFVLGLERLTRVGFDAELVLATARDADAYGDPAAGLRLLAHHWSELDHKAAPRMTAMATRLASRAGADLAARVGLSERCDPLVALALDALAPGGTDLAEVARLASLRARAISAPGTPPAGPDGFETAPGVAPLR